tara:strand:- start:78 stop:227 length:150 start_codon:yes stop_codon:yes gene_type:complete
LGFRFLVKDGGAGSFGEPGWRVYHLLEVNTFISIFDSNIPIEGEHEDNS